MTHSTQNPNMARRVNVPEVSAPSESFVNASSAEVSHSSGVSVQEPWEANRPKPTNPTRPFESFSRSSSYPGVSSTARTSRHYYQPTDSGKTSRQETSSDGDVAAPSQGITPDQGAAFNGGAATSDQGVAASGQMRNAQQAYHARGEAQTRQFDQPRYAGRHASRAQTQRSNDQANNAAYGGGYPQTNAPANGQINGAQYSPATVMQGDNAQNGYLNPAYDAFDDLHHDRVVVVEEHKKKESEKGVFTDLSMPQVIAGALAAVTSLLLSNVIGLAGSVIGVAVASIVSTVSSQAYKHFLAKSAENIKSHVHNEDDSNKEWEENIENGTAARPIPGAAATNTESRVATRQMQATRATATPHLGDKGAMTQAGIDKRASRIKKTKVQRGVIIISIISALLAVVVYAVFINVATQGQGVGTKTPSIISTDTSNSQLSSNRSNQSEPTTQRPESENNAAENNANTQNQNANNEQNAQNNASTNNSENNESSTSSSQNQSGTGESTTTNSGSSSTGSGTSGSQSQSSSQNSNSSSNSSSGSGTGTSGNSGSTSNNSSSSNGSGSNSSSSSNNSTSNGTSNGSNSSNGSSSATQTQ